ncbi:MAG: hypothetical protein JRG86_18270 [Deltaproteobacteria bacterium]|nr:hypothetical protein [Deltaproteobacteria bacterium]MBW2499938.1 hypothetical protein [Deltaproteobacteria bacterium]
MWTTIECAGHPRDMGQAQGAALRQTIRAELAHVGLPTRRSRLPTLRPLTHGRLRGAGAGRELFRHFAHQAERLEGLALRADVPIDSILAMHLRVRDGGVDAGLLARRASLRASRAPTTEGDAGAGAAGESRILLERSLPHPVAGEGGWIVRESRPVVGFRSVELTLPWLVPAVAGVNEAGLAVMAGPILWGSAGTRGWAPSHLLVQECLQRFGDLEGALDWCRKRPVEGEQSFVLADASLATATVLSTGRERRVQEGEGELYVEGGELPGDAEREGRSSGLGNDRVLLDPARRGLRLELGGATLDLSLAADLEEAAS